MSMFICQASSLYVLLLKLPVLQTLNIYVTLKHFILRIYKIYYIICVIYNVYW